MARHRLALLAGTLVTWSLLAGPAAVLVGSAARDASAMPHQSVGTLQVAAEIGASYKFGDAF